MHNRKRGIHFKILIRLVFFSLRYRPPPTLVTLTIFPRTTRTHHLTTTQAGTPISEPDGLSDCQS